jgi:hypothetical protein
VSSAVLLIVMGCVDDILPTGPQYTDERQAAVVPTALATELARASIEDAIERLLPALDGDVAPGLLNVLRQLADGLGQPDTAEATNPLGRAFAILDAAATQAGSGNAAEIDAITLALDAVEAALVDRPRP